MFKTKIRIQDRILAMLLAVVMLFTAMPANIYAEVNGAGDTFTVAEDAGKGETGEVADESQITYAEDSGESGSTSPEIEMHALTIKVEGNGIVAVDSEQVTLSEGNYSTELESETEVVVEITAPEGTILKSVFVNGVEKTITNEQSYSETLTITEDTTIAASVLNLYTVNVTTNENDLGTDVKAGIITLNNEEITNVTVEETSEVELAINTIENENCSYRISSVQINDDEVLEGGNVETFTKKITVDEVKTIVVEYVRVYTITIIGTDNENGTITTVPEHANGVIEVEDTTDDKFTISATPNDKYRVSSVKINGVEDSDEETKIKGQNGETYEKVLPANRNYTIEVAFALNRYSVVAETTDDTKGTIEFDENVLGGLINHGGSTIVTVTPESGYSIAEIIVQGGTTGEISVNEFTHVNGVATFELSNVIETKNVKVTFIETEKVSADYIVFNSSVDFIRQDGNTYIYPNNAEVTIKVNTENNNIGISDIRVYELVDGSEVLLGRDNPLEVILTETKSISKVEVYYQADNELCPNWHVVDGLSIGKVVIDKELSADDILLVFSDKPTKHYYNESFNVNIMANDTGDYSGIAEVSYWTEINENISQAETVIYPTTEETEIKDSVTVDALIEVSEEINNSEAVVVKVKVTDRAGNSVIKVAEPVRVNFTPPELVSIEVTGEQNAEAKDGYYTKRTARIRIKDREESFNPTNAKNGIEIEVVDTANIVPIPAMIGEWQHVEGSEGIYETTIIFTADARYNWSFDYTNEAGKELITTDATTITGDKVYEFVVDNTKPTAEIKIEETVWSELLTLLTFGIWKNDEVTVTAEATDVTAGVNTILYYKTADVDTLLTETELNALYGNNNEFSKFTEDKYIISANEENDSSEKFVVYARISDNAGNYKYICTDGIIVEDLEGSISFAGTDSANNYGFYNSDVNVAISVSENENVSSGIQKIEYKIYKDVEVDTNGQVVKGELTKQEILFNFDFVKNEEAINQIGTLTILDKSKEQETTVTNNCELTYDKLAKEWKGNITVDGGINNSDHVMVLVTVTDNAGNTYDNSIMLAINTDDVKAEISFLPTEETDPKNNEPNMVVEVEGEVEGEVEERGYFSLAERVATITITDRESAFYEENADEGIDIFATDADKKEIELTEGVDYVISEWRHSKDKETGEDKHTATVTFKTNANYTWSFNYTNKASNSLDVGEEGNLSTGDSETPFTFTVDDEDPTGSISLNENFWFELLELITFGLYSNDKVDMRATYEDEISPVIVEYYKTDDTVALKEEDLEKLREKGEFKPYDEENDVFPIEAENSNERLVVYLRITDYAGNVTYVSTDGFVLDNTLCEITLTPVTTTDPVQPVNNIYSQDVTIDVAINDAVNDDKSHSGIKNIAYKIYKDATVEDGKVTSGEVTAQDILYSFDFVKNEGAVNQIGTLTVIDQSKGTAEPVIKNNVELTYDQLTASWEGKIIVDAEDNNSCDVVVEVTVVDNAGNEVTQLLKLDIDITHPTIEVSFDNNEDNNGNGYFTDTRKATVVITERTQHFNRTKATEAIKITAVDALGKTVPDAYKIPEIEEWISVEGATADEATHTATIVFEKDANYTWEISYEGDAAYVDEAGNANEEPIDTGDSVAPFKFTIDREAPNGVITATAEGIDKDEQKVTRTEDWSELRPKEDEFKFGFWSNGSIKFTGTYTDDTSVEMAKVEYFKEVVTKGEAGSETPKTNEELDAITTWTAFDELIVEEEERFVVYLKITDPAGNYSYICTNGLIIDHTKPIEETIAPEITTTPIKQPLNGIYREDVTVAVKVVEPEKGDIYSGLKRIGYKVFNMGEATQNDELFLFEVENPTQDDAINVWEKKDAFVVKATKNNSNNVKIVVFAEDNAGNYSEDEVSIKIDTTAPSIQVAYNNNAPDNGKYFNADRTATITITERNFKEEDVKITISNTDGTVPPNPKWSKTDGSGNGDNTKWTGTITYSADGDYKFDITYTDLAGLKASAPQYGDSVVPTEFTIDKTLPVVSVSYDNNNVANDKYFNAPRTAEVKIVEHNFDVSRVQFNFDVNGAGGTQPTVSWREDGDTHTAVLSYASDADYTFDVTTVQDMAGNNFETVDYGNSVAAQEFTVDTEVEAPVIGGIDAEDNAYGYDEEIIPTVTVEDINYDRSEVCLYRTSRADIDVDVTEQYIGQIEGGVSGGNKEYPIFEKDEEGKYNREMEGFYRMTATVWDKAGNESETAEAEFFINRFGSVYIYDEEYLVPLIGTYVQEVEEDLVIKEYNATEVDVDSVKVEITRDGKPVENTIATETKSYEPSPEEGRGWYEYHHTIKKDNFLDEGTYKVAVSSEDKAKNISENTNYEDMGIMFYVDKEAPEFTRILGLDSAIVDATELKIEYSIYDAIGLKSILVKVNGEQIGEAITDFGDDINNYSGSIVLNESTEAQSVQFVVEDLSGRITDTSTEEFQKQYSDDYQKTFINSVTVTTNDWVRFYANKPLFWGTIGGGSATVATIGAIIAFLRKRKLKAVSK